MAGGIAAHDPPQIDVQLLTAEKHGNGPSGVEGDADRARQKVARSPREHPEGPRYSSERPGRLHRRAVTAQGEHRVVAGRPLENQLGRVARALGEDNVAIDAGLSQRADGARKATPPQPGCGVRDEEDAPHGRPRGFSGALLPRVQKCQTLWRDRPHCRGVWMTFPSE